MARTALLLATLLLAACDGGDKGKPPAPQATPATETAPLNQIDASFAGTPAPDIRLELPDEGEIRLPALIQNAGGRRVLVNLWATWCAPCLAEMPELDALAAAAPETLLVVPVSQDMEGWQAVNGFFSPGRFKTLSPLLDQPGSLGEALSARGLPMSILYAPDGRELWRVSGTPDWASASVRASVSG
jgi:thiol-disulfide isomerase/thioredoxin